MGNNIWNMICGTQPKALLTKDENRRMKYILIYTLSTLLLFFVWYRGFEIPKRVQQMESYSMELPSPPQEMSNDTTIVYLKREPALTSYVEKSIFDYVNEIITTLVGLVNIITFVYQMKDRKQNKVEGQ